VLQLLCGLSTLASVETQLARLEGPREPSISEGPWRMHSFCWQGTARQDLVVGVSPTETKLAESLGECKTRMTPNGSAWQGMQVVPLATGHLMWAGAPRLALALEEAQSWCLDEEAGGCSSRVRATVQPPAPPRRR